MAHEIQGPLLGFIKHSSEAFANQTGAQKLDTAKKKYRDHR